MGNDGRAFSFIDWVDDAKVQRDLVRILKQSGQVGLLILSILSFLSILFIHQVVPDFLLPGPDGSFKGDSFPRVDLDAQKHRFL